MKKKLLFSGIIALLVIFLSATVSYGVWENAVWLGTDLGQTGRKMGYFHDDKIATKIISQHVNGEFSSEIQVGSTLVSFSDSSGLYAMVGGKTNGRLDFLFGAGFNYKNRYSPFLLTGGVKCLVPSQQVIYEIDAFYQILPPLLVNLSYDSHAETIFIGLGLSYN
ncbi:MAG TPA: hypothetical protein DEB05_05885 [Firmicutes bacterium]|jgi:hypothetical protein|nr:hypothetical protein [Bacillota bacterium]